MNNNNEIRQANRKALPRFILILLLCCLGGGFLGFCAARFGLARLADTLRAAGAWFSACLAPWLLAACAVASLAVCLPICLRAKAMADRWDGEDDSAYAAIDRELSRGQRISTPLLIAGFFLLAASYSGAFSADRSPLGFCAAILSFLVLMISQVVLSQKTVDTAKRLAPEKRGSVYDLGFQSKWLDSCDEAERALIGQCAYKAFRAVNIACVILWMVFTLTALFLDTGLLAPLAVCVIWAVAAGTYIHWAAKLPACAL